jgi:hypothetical protein
VQLFHAAVPSCKRWHVHCNTSAAGNAAKPFTIKKQDMKKSAFLFVLLVSAFGSAWSQAYLGQAEYNKTQHPALVLSLPYSESVAEGTILSNLKKTGYDPETKGKLFWKRNTVDGYYVFKGVRLEGVQQPLDLYFKFDHKRRQKNSSTVYMLTSSGEENFVDPATNDSTYAAAKQFLNSFVSETATYKLNLDIGAQEEAVRNAEKKYARLQEDERDMNKKIENLQNDIRKNQEQQQDQQRAIEEERRKLTELQTKTTPQS